MAFIELVLSTLEAWSREGAHVLRKARGGDAPYRIRNRTGGSVHVWSDLDESNSRNSAAVKITSGETIDWRFDDWKTLREVWAPHVYIRTYGCISFDSMFLRPDITVLLSNLSRNLGSYGIFQLTGKESILIRFVQRHRRSVQDCYAK